MRSGNIRSGFQATVPIIYIDPVILFNPDGTLDKATPSIILDLWKNYSLNIRYLHVIKPLSPPSDVITKLATTNLQFKVETVEEHLLLDKLFPELVACFFGERDKVPSNHKVFSKDQFLNEYATILSARRSEDTASKISNRYRRRRE